MAITLGRKYRDLITGFSGVATGCVQYITGCNQVLLAPPVDGDGKIRDPQWFDETRLEDSGAATIVLDSASTRSNPGPDREAPKR